MVYNGCMLYIICLDVCCLYCACVNLLHWTVWICTNLCIYHVLCIYSFLLCILHLAYILSVLCPKSLLSWCLLQYQDVPWSYSSKDSYSDSNNQPRTLGHLQCLNLPLSGNVCHPLQYFLIYLIRLPLFQSVLSFTHSSFSLFICTHDSQLISPLDILFNSKSKDLWNVSCFWIFLNNGDSSTW